MPTLHYKLCVHFKYAFLQKENLRITFVISFKTQYSQQSD